MTRLGDVLELLHGAAERARPARLTVVEWTHRSRSAAAFDRFMAEHHGRHAGAAVAHIASAASAPAAPQETSRTTRLALESPTRYREESAGVQAGKRYQVRDGERWVVWDADGWRLVESLFTAGRAQPAIEAEVSLGYASPDGASTVSVGQRAASDLARALAPAPAEAPRLPPR